MHSESLGTPALKALSRNRMETGGEPISGMQTIWAIVKARKRIL